jgi:putative lipoic acid-binding regulatory protein
MAPDGQGPKLDLPYPCRWGYKVIGEDEQALRSAVADIVQAREHSVSLSRRSAHRNYCSLNIEVLVYDEEDRVTIYEALSAHPAVKLVL